VGLARCGKGSVTTGLKPCSGAATIDSLEQPVKIDLEAAFLVILSSNTAIRRLALYSIMTQRPYCLELDGNKQAFIILRKQQD
jgi:hypothetical protein